MYIVLDIYIYTYKVIHFFSTYTTIGHQSNETSESVDMLTDNYLRNSKIK